MIGSYSVLDDFVMDINAELEEPVYVFEDDLPIHQIAEKEIAEPIASKERKNLDKCCKCKNRNNCELIAEYNLLLENNPDAENYTYTQYAIESCVLNKFWIESCGTEYVNDGIGEHYKVKIDTQYMIKENTENRWEPCQPVYISAPTGRGKNRFIEKTLIPFIKKLNREYTTKFRILIIGNRRALKMQVKDRINNESEKDIYQYADFTDVMLYQSIIKSEGRFINQQNIIKEKYLFVVCDEAHFFTSDASFNPNTEKILSAITQIFKNSIRIYMTATPYESFKFIEEYESNIDYKAGVNNTYFDIDSDASYKEFRKETRKLEKLISKDREPIFGVCYHFKRNYSFLNVKYFSNEETELIPIISSSKERWLIFIDDIDRGNRFKEILERFCGTEDEFDDKEENGINEEKVLIYAINANSKGNAKYQQMILNEEFHRVLIATSVIDNGVNFRKVQNVVLTDTSKAKCLQMLGRARLDSSDTRITLYLKRFDSEIFRSRLNFLEEYNTAIGYYDLAYNPSPPAYGTRRESNHEWDFLNKYYNSNYGDWKNAKHWFGRDFKNPTKLFPNKIMKFLVDESEPAYQSILDEIESTVVQDKNTEKKIVGQKYLEYQLSWFGRTYTIDDDITFMNKENAKNEFIDFLDSYVNKTENGETMNADEFKTFRAEFTKLHDKVFSRRSNRKEDIYSNIIIKAVFEDHNLNYRLDVIDSRPKTYRIVRLMDEPDKL